jgi:hypothetical protein
MEIAQQATAGAEPHAAVRLARQLARQPRSARRVRQLWGRAGAAMGLRVAVRSAFAALLTSAARGRLGCLCGALATPLLRCAARCGRA